MMHTTLMIVLFVSLILYGGGYRAYTQGQMVKAVVLFSGSVSLLLIRIIAQPWGDNNAI